MRQSRWDEFVFPPGNGCFATFRSFTGGEPPKEGEMPMMEDIELGLRLRRLGKTRLDPRLQVKHLKHWTLVSLIETEISSRARPWSELILESGTMPNDLNLESSQRLAAAVAPFALLAPPTLVLAVALGDKNLLAIASVPILVSVAASWPLLRFFRRTVGPGAPVGIRSDSAWNVTEPEIGLVLGDGGEIAGVTIGNDVSSRDIEGANPLYLPQAKIYKQSCSVGPLITPVAAMPPLAGVEIRLVIRRGGKVAFEGTTTLSQMARTPESLVEWLGRENEFPNGVVLLTGTGIVPPDEFSLAPGDEAAISIAGIGTLTNPVV